MELVVHTRDCCPEELRNAVQRCEARFNLRFDTLACFPKAAFDRFHDQKKFSDLPDSMSILSETDAGVIREFEILTAVANSPTPSRADRVEYLNALLRVYDRMLPTPRTACAEPGSLCVGVEREGRILAQRHGCLDSDRVFCPHAKRIPHGSGLVVGLTTSPDLPDYERCVIVDGAIASGATLMAIIESIRHRISRFQIFSVHSTLQGLWGLVRFGQEQGVDISASVGHVTSGINSKYYAIDPTDSTKLVVGDLGDTISDLSA